LLKWTLEDTKKAVAYFQQALEKDQALAPAYSGLADSYLFLSGSDLDPKDAIPQARAAIMKALELDDTLVEAHLSLGDLRMRMEWDFVGVEKEYKRAIELNPNHAMAHNQYGNYLVNMGRFDEAIAEHKRALELDPVSTWMVTGLGWAFRAAGQCDQAIKVYHQVLEIDPNWIPALWGLAACYEQKRMYAEAIAALQKVKAIVGEEIHDFDGQLGYLYAVSGQRGEALKRLNKLRELARQKYIFPSVIAAIYAGLGEKDQAFDWLQKGCRDRDENMAQLKATHYWHGLRSDPRYQDLLRCVGLPP
jgi:tetratricopeptide (TPR) repeat protein